MLRVTAFRRLWIALTLSSLGDWLGLLATTALAQQLAQRSGGGLAAQNFAIGGVLIFRLLPAVVLGPLAGVLADRFDRRTTMVVCDVMRFLLFASIPLVDSLAWLLAASFLIESISLFWIPAKDATVPNLVRRDQLEAANQLSLITTYGTAAVAAAIFALLAVLTTVLATALPFFDTNPVDLALYFDAATFAFSAMTVFRLGGNIPRGGAVSRARAAAQAPVKQTVLSSLFEGWRFARQTPFVRGLLIGVLGAVVAGGAVVALGRTFVGLLGGGNAAYGVLFGAVFLGLAGGMYFGPRLLADFSRRRLFGLAIMGAGGSLAVTALLPNLVLALILVTCVGLFAGVAWVVGYTLIGAEVADEVRGRTFALLYSLIRIDLLLTLAVAPFLAGALDEVLSGATVELPGGELRFYGTTIVLCVGGLLGVVVGALSYQQMDDRPGVPLLADLLASIRGEGVYGGRGHARGMLIAIEGGEGAGKSTQARLLADWLGKLGREVVVTREPGATPAGARLRELLLDTGSAGLSARAEALLYAADRADHVDRVIRPALQRGAVVVTDRYVDSSIAYQGAGRQLPAEEVARISRWATDDLVPDLTVLLDVDPAVGLRRLDHARDRLEAESLEFHHRVRRAFRALADRHPRRYLVVCADEPPDRIQAAVRARLAPLLGRPSAHRTGAEPAEVPVEAPAEVPVPRS